MKQLLAWLPLAAIAIAAVPVHQQWQQSQLARPDYDNPNAEWKKPTVGKPFSQMQSECWDVVPGSVEDGSTFQAQRQGRTQKIRLACVNVPPLDQPLGVESRDYLKSLLSQANNRVILTVTDTDRQGGKVAEVNVSTLKPNEEKLVQYEMAVAGLAYPIERFADHCLNWDAVQQGGGEAKERQRGVWKDAQAVKP